MVGPIKNTRVGVLNSGIIFGLEPNMLQLVLRLIEHQLPDDAHCRYRIVLPLLGLTRLLVLLVSNTVLTS